MARQTHVIVPDKISICAKGSLIAKRGIQQIPSYTGRASRTGYITVRAGSVARCALADIVVKGVVKFNGAVENALLRDVQVADRAACAFYKS